MWPVKVLAEALADVLANGMRSGLGPGKMIISIFL